MTVAFDTPHAKAAIQEAPTAILRVALLGLGQVGSALASLLHEQPALQRRFAIAGALVRDLARPRGPAATGIPLTTEGTSLLTPDTGVVVEVLGGIEPARSLVLGALERGLPVVTANKSLLAAHGDELLEAAHHARAPLRYEASVIAGVPFLGLLERRPLAADVASLRGIVNGTSNFILSTMASGRGPFEAALAAAQAHGYAEPEPANDIRGIDAAEKLCVLLRHFGGWSVRPAAIETTGIDELIPQDLEHARWFGGAIRPVVCADWRGDVPEAFAGPAFVDERHPFAHVDGVTNAIALHSRWCGDLVFSGPGAGPAATAATLLDDANEAGREQFVGAWSAARTAASCGAPTTGWFVRLCAMRLPEADDLARQFDAGGISLRRTGALDTRTATECQWVLTHPCSRGRIGRAIAALRAAGCEGHAVRVLA